MNYILRFFPETEEDIINGYRWYETKSLGLGAEFLRVVYDCAGTIEDNPLLYPKVYHEFRRCLLRKFPFVVYFVIKDEWIIVFGIFHCARNPRIIRKDLRSRKKSEQF